MTTHTPGPWAIDPHSGNLEIQQEETDFTVAKIYGNGPMHQANARLIAAAPELLAALQVVAALQIEPGAITTGKPLSLAIDAAIAAIAKVAA